MKYVLSLLIAILFLVPSPAAGTDYTLGKDGLYYDSAGAAYVRKDNWEYQAASSYTYCNRCYSTPAKWVFTGYSYTPYQAKASDPQAEYDYFKNRIADAIVIKQKQEADLILRANLHNQTMELIQEAGLTGSLRGSGLLPELAMPYRNKYAAAYYPTIQGNTIYGPQQTIVAADFYGAFDRNLFAQQASAFTRDGLVMIGEAHKANLVMADKFGSGDTRIAETFYKGQAASMALQSAAPAPSASYRESHTSPGAIGPAPLSSLQLSPRKQSAMRACIQCHGDQNPQGGFRVSQYWSLPYEEQLRIAGKLLVKDTRSQEFMPRGQQRLPANVIAEFLPVERVAQ